MNSAFEQSIGTISGTAGLVVALRALVGRESYVAVPATVCPNVVAAILAADCKPFFIDIERQTLGIDPRALQADIDAVGAVVAVHAAGTPCRIDEIAELCRVRGKVLIEDCAQADGATLDGKSAGGWGDASIFSYGSGKILDLGGGGLLLGRDAAIRARLQEAAEALPADRAPAAALEIAAQLNATYKHLYNSRYPSKLASHQDEFLEQLRKVGTAGLARATARQRDDILAARNTQLAQTLALRRQKREIYRHSLADVPEIVLMPDREGSAPWRFNIWVRDILRDELLQSMLADGMNISSWHPDIRPYLPLSSYRSAKLTQAQWYSDGVINLWLDDQTSEADIRQMSDEITRRIAMFDSARQSAGRVSPKFAG